MTTYELIIDQTIKDNGLDTYNEWQNYYVLRASVISGIIAALLTNSLEVIVVRQ